MSRHGGVRRSSPRGRRLEDPFAITSTGIVLVNAIWFDGVETVEDAMRRALRERSRVFVGVALEGEEVRYVVDHMSDLIEESAGFVIGARQRQTKG